MSPIVESNGAAAGGGVFAELAYAQFTADHTGVGTIVTTGNVTLAGNEVLMVHVYCAYIQLNSSGGSAQGDLYIDGAIQGHFTYAYAATLTDTRFTCSASKRVTGLASGDHTFAWVDASGHGDYQAQTGVGTDICPGFIQVLQIG